MAHRIGIDVVEVSRIGRSLKRSRGFVERIFTLDELRLCSVRRTAAECLAARFAAKEAVVKAIGCGFSGFWPRCVEVVVSREGVPRVVLHGAALLAARKKGVKTVEISISHAGAYAAAVALAELEEG